jgi:hypothetical protein
MKTKKTKLSDVINSITVAGFELDGPYGAVDYRMFPSPAGTTVCVVPRGSPADETPLVDFFLNDDGNVTNFDGKLDFLVDYSRKRLAA